MHLLAQGEMVGSIVGLDTKRLSLVSSRTPVKTLKAMVNGFEAYETHSSWIFNLCMLSSTYSVYT